MNTAYKNTHIGFYGLWGLSIGVMVFILYKLYFLSPYSNPTPKPSPHRKLCAFFDLKKKKNHSVWFISLLNYRDTESVLINHLHVVIPMSYPCYYTNLCPHKPHKHAHTQVRNLMILVLITIPLNNSSSVTNLLMILYKFWGMNTEWIFNYLASCCWITFQTWTEQQQLKKIIINLWSRWWLSTLRWPLQPWISAETRTTRWAPETDPLRRPCHLDGHQDKTTETRWVLCTNWLCCCMEQTAGSSGQRRTGPPTEPGFSQVFFPISVADGFLITCRCRLWLA